MRFAFKKIFRKIKDFYTNCLVSSRFSNFFYSEQIFFLYSITDISVLNKMKLTIYIFWYKFPFSELYNFWNAFYHEQQRSKEMLRERNLIPFCLNTYHKTKIRIFEISKHFTLQNLNTKIVKFDNKFQRNEFNF